jgi:hypothetical protein
MDDVMEKTAWLELGRKPGYTPPFNEIKDLFKSSGYEVISAKAERNGLKFTGVIHLDIAPADWLKETDYAMFPPFLKTAVSPEGAAQSYRQGEGTGEG